MFTSFPTGRAGAGLLLLRIVVGLVALLQHVQALSYGRDVSWRMGVDLAAAVGGALILAGFLTPFAAGSVAAVFSLSHFFVIPPALNGLTVLLLTAGSVAVALLGAGAWSIDARVFGRREIVIPRRENHHDGATDW